MAETNGLNTQIDKNVPIRINFDDRVQFFEDDQPLAVRPAYIPGRSQWIYFKDNGVVATCTRPCAQGSVDIYFDVRMAVLSRQEITIRGRVAVQSDTFGDAFDYQKKRQLFEELGLQSIRTGVKN
ncbi:MAG: hypothetical protein KKD18_05160 [Nanoarchaeota archaeon]|nr:hypothetical protein [Nanoarchaeota archaeon]MBU0977778.1 hypothetical protein [Nanoarchaeota archaeon]